MSINYNATTRKSLFLVTLAPVLAATASGTAATSAAAAAALAVVVNEVVGDNRHDKELQSSERFVGVS